MAEEIKGRPNGAGKRFAIVVSRFNRIVGRALLKACEETLKEEGVAEEDITVVWVPGAFEIPVTAKRLARQGGFHAVICLGAVIRGETSHYEHISREVARGIGEVSRETGLPVIFGVLTTDTADQAMQRSGPKDNKGAEAAWVAIEMANLFARLDEEKPGR